jgi:hypothetical protein
VFASIWNWILIMVFGTGATITTTPVDIQAGEAFFRAPEEIQPVIDTVRVGIDLGTITEEKKREVLYGSRRLSEIGEITVLVCKNLGECIPMTYTGSYFSRTSYGIGFDASGPQLKHTSFVGVKVRTDRPLRHVLIGWSNYRQ